MIKTDKQTFLEKSSTALSQIFEEVNSSEVLEFSNLDTKKTVLIVVDMINGFIREGALSCPAIEKIIPSIKKLMTSCIKNLIPIIAFADSHTENSPEFEAYPIHCVAETSESELISELKEIQEYKLINKNSTNGFLEKDFQKFLFTNPQIHTFIVTGCCTDICVLQFCLSLKAYFNNENKNADIIVPINSIETFDLGSHDSGLMNVISLKLLQNAGIKLVNEIK